MCFFLNANANVQERSVDYLVHLLSFPFSFAKPMWLTDAINMLLDELRVKSQEYLLSYVPKAEQWNSGGGCNIRIVSFENKLKTPIFVFHSAVLHTGDYHWHQGSELLVWTKILEQSHSWVRSLLDNPIGFLFRLLPPRSSEDGKGKGLNEKSQQTRKQMCCQLAEI